MNPTPRQRWIVLGGLLLATLAAGMMIEEEAADEPEPRRPRSERPAAPTAGALPPAPVAAQPLPPTADAAPLPDPFRSHSWYIAPPPPPPAQPVAPPLPFSYLGKVIEDKEIRVFLAYQGRHLIARQGDKLDRNYVVEAIEGNRMRIRYLPLNEEQELAIGGES
ncbi:MAG: hypothetical protein CVU34_04805 [Betaproteobacteria bacterium HGW-Betaproteobacteria-7]|jgi:hypothetical protein|nr:MAG: hypothetical protein CVU34_04805 [Betaproteobacteria bacterium HGW-Betaproteobacteria-7]